MQIIELVRTGYIFPRVALIAFCCAWLFGLGAAAPRVFRRGAYSFGLRAAYAACVALYLFTPVYAAFTL